MNIIKTPFGISLKMNKYRLINRKQNSSNGQTKQQQPKKKEVSFLRVDLVKFNLFQSEYFGFIQTKKYIF